MNRNELTENENAALKEILKNDYYRKLYEEAPDGAKAYYRNSFLGSLLAMKDGNGEEDAVDDERNEILKLLADEDWKYLKSHAPNAVVACGLHATQQRIRKERNRAIA